MHYREEKFEAFIEHEHALKGIRRSAWTNAVNNNSGSEKVYFNDGLSFIFTFVCPVGGFICLFFAVPVAIALFAACFIYCKITSEMERKLVDKWQRKHGFHIEDCEARHGKFAEEMRAEIAEKDAELKKELRQLEEAIAEYEKI